MHKAEDVMPVRINWNRPTVSKNVVEDPPKGMDRLQLLALAKAASISKTVCDVSLGVNSKQVAHNDCEGDGALEAESMQLHSQINDSNVDVVDSTRNKSSEHVTPPIDGLDVTSRCIIKQRATIDHQREMEVREIIKNHVQKMEETVRNQREILKSKNEGIKREREGRVLQAGQEILREIHEGEVQASQRQLLLAQKHKQHEQRMNARNQMIKEAEKRRKELEEEEKKKMREKKELLGKMIQYLMDFKVKNDEMVDTMRKCKNKELLISKVCSETLKLRKYFEALEQFVNLCKVGEANNKYLQEAAAIMQKAEAVIQSVCAEVANINAEYEKAIEEKAEKQKEESVKQPAAVSAPAVPVPAAPAPAPAPAPALAPAAPPASSHTSDLSDFADEASYKMYISLQEYLKNFDSSCEALVKDESVKKFRFNCQKAVNIPVNAIAPTSATHIQDKYLKLSKLISGQMVYVGNGSFSASTHPQGVAYCKSLLAKKFVYQGEMTVSSKPEAAFAIAAVIVALWTEFPDFGQLLLAHFYKECPYLVPVFMPQVEGQSNSDYYKTLGYHFSENGEVESHDKFLKRMSGIMRLYAAILVTHPRRHQRQPNPHGLALAWRWLACLLNLEPMPDICATLLYDFLDVTGNAMCNTYGQQFQKLLHLIAKEYFPKINTKTTVSSGPLVRLEVFLQKVLKQQGRIPPPSGILPPNFW